MITINGNLGSPYFTKEMKNQTLSKGQTLEYVLPPIVDPDNDLIIVNFDLGVLQKYATTSI